MQPKELPTKNSSNKASYSATKPTYKPEKDIPRPKTQSLSNTITTQNEGLHTTGTNETPNKPNKKRVWLFALLGIFAFLIWPLISFDLGQKSNKPTKENSQKTESSNIITEINTPYSVETSQNIEDVKNYNTVQVSFIDKKRTRANPTIYNEHQIPSTVTSIKNISVPDNEVSYIVLNNLLLLRSSLQALESAGWPKSGDYGENINIDYRDLDLDEFKLKEIIEVEKIKESERKLPEYLDDMYTSSQAKEELNILTHIAYQEYLTYLDQMGVNGKYIEEMKKIVPNVDDRVYYTISENSPSSSYALKDKNGLVDDYSARVLEITSGSIYNDTKILFNSRILGEPPQNSQEDEKLLKYYIDLRNMAVRLSVYHEATHILQRAYMTENSPDSARKEQHIYRDSSKLLSDLDTQNKWQWSKYPQEKEFDELTRTQESQADGIAFEVLTNIYDMNTRQRDALWTHFFGRLDPTWAIIKDIKNLYEKNWPDMTNKIDFGSTLAKTIFLEFNAPGEDRIVLPRTLRNSNSLASDAGYNDPIRPEETAEFWDRLKN